MSEPLDKDTFLMWQTSHDNRISEFIRTQTEFNLTIAQRVTAMETKQMGQESKIATRASLWGGIIAALVGGGITIWK